MVSIDRMLAEELAIELQPLLPGCTVAASRSEWVSGNHWQVNVWLGGQPRFTASFKPDVILVTTLNRPGRWAVVSTTVTLDYCDPACVEAALGLAVEAGSWTSP